MKHKGKTALSLLEYLVGYSGCEYLSDLHYLAEWQKVRLAQKIERIPCSEASLSEWNDALCYLTNLPKEQSAEKARRQLLLCLSHSLHKN